MRRLVAVAIVLGVLASGCLFRSSPQDAKEELVEIATKVDGATFAASYRFGFTRQFAPGISTRMEITQQPPVSVRKVETTTKPEEGDDITVTAWYVTNADGDFVCSEFPEVGIKCQSNPVASATFGTARLDVFFETPRDPDAFASVRKATRPVRVQGQQGTCYEAVPAPPSPAPASPDPTPDRFRFEFCYAADGVLLQARRTTLDESGGDGSESFVEATSISRVVQPSELRLPGPVVTTDDLPQE